jgi:succinoglycan biosynthesis transport protein ExoP
MNNEDNLFAAENGRQSSLTARDILQVGFRHKTTLLAVFGTLSVIVLAYVFILPPKYEAETKILVRQGRIDPVVSPTANVPLTVRQPLTEEELNSEVEILLSDDVLRQVVIACGLDRAKAAIPLPLLRRADDPHTRMGTAVSELKSALKVVPVKKTSVIEVNYQRRNAQQAAEVLKALNAAYIDKHVEAHRSGGQFKFFEQQAEDYRERLRTAEQRLQDFSKSQNSVRPEMVRDEMLQQLTTLNGDIAATGAEIAQTENRLQTLEQQAQSLPARITTSVKTSDNEQLMQQLKSTLLTLELKRTDLLSKFQPDYRPVQELEQEIEKTRAAIAAEDASPLRESTTDADPTHTLVTTELTKAKADLSGLRARQTTMQKTAQRYQTVIHDLENKSRLEQDLLREAKAAEENYLLYVQKREQSRITDALDQMRILNIAIVEEPSIPVLPTHSRSILAIAGLLFAAVVSVVVVFVLDFFDSSFHAPREIESALNIPVLAAVPRFEHSNGYRNGNGKGNGTKPKPTAEKTSAALS